MQNPFLNVIFSGKSPSNPTDIATQNLFYYNNPFVFLFEQHYKPGSVLDDHLSWLYVTAQLLCPVTRTERDQPGSTTGRRIASYSVLLRVEFTQPCLLPAKRWALTPPFHHHKRLLGQKSLWFLRITGILLPSYLLFLFYCTSLGVTSTGRYPAPCPVKPGLSSPGD